MPTRSVNILIQGRDEASGAINRVNKSLGGLKNRISGFGGLSLEGLLGGLGAGALFSHVIGEYTAAEQSGLKLEAVLRATGNAAGFTAKELGDFADSLQQTTNFEGDATKSALAVLATFKEIKGQTFKDATIAAMDLSTVMGQDLQSSIVQIGKALNDPIRGMTALARVGVSFTEQQKEQIKGFVEANDLLSAQRVILDELTSEFGGAAEATASPLAQLKNDLGDIAEIIGGTMADGLREVMPMLRGFANDIKSITSGPKEQAGEIPVIRDLINTDGLQKARLDFAAALNEVKALEDLKRRLGADGTDTSNLDTVIAAARDKAGGIGAEVTRLRLQQKAADEVFKNATPVDLGLGGVFGGASSGIAGLFGAAGQGAAGAGGAAQDFLNQMKADQAFKAKIFAETRTPQEKFDADMAKLNANRGVLGEDLFARRQQQLQDELDKSLPKDKEEKFKQERRALAPLTEARFLTAAPGYASDPAAIAKQQANDTKEAKEVQKQQLVVLRAMERKLQRQARLGVL